MSRRKIIKSYSDEENSSKEYKETKYHSIDSFNILSSLKCERCDKIYDNNDDLKKHLQEVHLNNIINKIDLDKKFVCQQCHCEYDNFNQFADHMKSHIHYNNISKDPTSCPICKQIFTKNKMFQLHILDHFLTTSCTFICSHCPKEIFYDNNSYKQHFIEKHSETLYRCSHCLQLFYQYNLFQDHMLIHRKEIFQFKCIICSITFPTIDTFTSHIQLIHENGNRIIPMVVPLIQQQNSTINCVSKNYKNNSTDNDEKSIFMINNNLKCSVCDIECDSQYSLDNHRLQTHCKIGKSNRCGICHNILDSKDIFVEHSLEHNDDVSQISCCVCRQTVKSQWQLSMHAEFHLDIFSNLLSKIQESNLTEETINNEKKQTNNADSNNENNSSTSPATSTDSKDEEMKKIIEINEFTCNTCFKQFTSLNALQGHSHIHRHPRNHRCDLCKMAFSTKARLEIHKKKHYCNKDVKCQICDEKFNKSDLLKKHMKTHESNLKNIS